MACVSGDTPTDHGDSSVGTGAGGGAGGGAGSASFGGAFGCFFGPADAVVAAIATNRSARFT